MSPKEQKTEERCGECDGTKVVEGPDCGTCDYGNCSPDIPCPSCTQPPAKGEEKRETWEETGHFWKVVSSFVGGGFPERKVKVLRDAVKTLIAQSKQELGEKVLGAVPDDSDDDWTKVAKAERPIVATHYMRGRLDARSAIISVLRENGVEVKGV